MYLFIFFFVTNFVCKTFNQTTKIWNVTKLKVFADDKFNIDKMTISLLDKLENTVGKGENAGYQHFLLFPTVFSKAFFFRVVKSRDCLAKS